MTRDDLLTLTPDVLAALANRGLVKRATKALDAGTAPAVEVGEDGTVRGRFEDGVEAALPVHTDLRAATCTCAAPGVCRHRVGLVLAYQRQFGPRQADNSDGRSGKPEDDTGKPDDPPEPTPPAAHTPWSPGSVDDDTLTRLYGAPALAAARRALTAGFPARLRRPTSADPVARADLRSCTVRFPVPDEVGYAYTDAADTARAEMVVLAVWAFRAADERGLNAADVHLDVGGPARELADSPLAPSGLAPVLTVVDELLLDGAGHADGVLVSSLHRAARDLGEQGLRWPSAALDDLVEQLGAYRERATRHRPERVAELLAELHARHRAAVHSGGATPRSRVLGSDEPAETPLRRVRLTGLGCRITGTDTNGTDSEGTTAERTAEVFLAHPDSGTVLVLHKRWPVSGADGEPLTGADLATRRLSGVPLHTLAAAHLVSESASRSAGRVVRLASHRVARTSVRPLDSQAWESLPDSVTARDLATLERQLGGLAPKLIRPRVEAELVRAVPVAEVLALGYDPGDQRLDAVITDAAGMTATVSATYDAARPGALDCLAAALGGDLGTPLFVSGVVRRARGGITLRPLAVMTDQGPVLPDLAPGSGDADLVAAPRRPQGPEDALHDALHTALGVCADAAHQGLRNPTTALRTRLTDAAAALSAVGLRTTAGLLTALSSALTGGDPETMVTAWVAAQVRLTTTAELC
ncbi:hypothetical protein [Streptomyces sp. NPDC097640]|uniref:hypothetical protein n=1 Tax=Streptomyces sp. NPDC097640 TaxID=3157229 RepID=UPI00331B1255